MTHDVDLWIELPARQYMKPVNIARGLGGTMLRNTVVELTDGMLINFVYAVDGLGSFASELRKSVRLRFHDCEVPALPLESIRKSKASIMREKDAVHIHYIDEVLRLRQKHDAAIKKQRAGARLK